MSSLMQFGGETGRQGVRLEFVYPMKILHAPGHAFFVCCDPVPCTTCGKVHGRIYRAWRKPVGMFGPWVQFRYNGDVHAPDLSIPIEVERMPRDAEPVSDDDNARLWHRS